MSYSESYIKLPNVKIITNKNGDMLKCEIDGVDYKSVQSVNVYLGVRKIPIVDIKLIANVKINEESEE